MVLEWCYNGVTMVLPSLASRRSTRRRTIPTRFRLDTIDVTRSCVTDSCQMEIERDGEKKKINKELKK
jgi:hypothetical protein